MDVQLQLASTGQSVNIAADSAGLQTDRADVNTQVTKQEIADLPLTGTNGTRNFESIFQTIPGFSPPAASHSIASNPTEAQAFNVNGSTYTGNNIKLDGASDIFPWLPEIASYIPPSEAIETVSVVTNSFDAEQGFEAGSNINVIINQALISFTELPGSTTPIAP